MALNTLGLTVNKKNDQFSFQNHDVHCPWEDWLIILAKEACHENLETKIQVCFMHPIFLQKFKNFVNQQFYHSKKKNYTEKLIWSDYFYSLANLSIKKYLKARKYCKCKVY